MTTLSKAVDIALADTTPKAIRTSVNSALTGLTFTFGTGDEVTLMVDSLSPEIRAMAMLHGLRQKVQDAAAIARNPDTGRSATFGDKRDAAMEVYERLLAGHWNKPTAGGERDASGGMLLRALMEVYPTAGQDVLKARITGWNAEQKTVIRNNPKIKAVLDRMAAEKVAAKGIDASDLLEGL